MHVFSFLWASAFCTALLAPAHAQIVFDDFNDGDVSDVTFSSTSGDGIGVAPIDGRDGTPPSGLYVALGPSVAGGSASFTIPGGVGTIDVSTATYFSFYLRTSAVNADNLPLVLEINLREDVDGNGTFDGATEDEYQVRYRIDRGIGYRFIQIPLASFIDDNTATPGADDGFDFSKLLELTIDLPNLQGSDFVFSMDDLVFLPAERPLAGPFAAFENFDDGDITDVFTFSDNGDFGIDVRTTDDGDGTNDVALAVLVDPALTGSSAGMIITGDEGIQDIATAGYLIFRLRPTTVSAENVPFLLEIQLREDTNEDGGFNGFTEDRYHAFYRVSLGTEYTNVLIPLNAFVDDNSGQDGNDDGFDFSKLLDIIVIMRGLQGPAFSIAFDDWIAANGLPVASVQHPTFVRTPPVVFPNPATTQATVQLDLATASSVGVEVYGRSGSQVGGVPTATYPRGPVHLALATDQLPSGPYFVRIRTAAGVTASQMLIVR